MPIIDATNPEILKLGISEGVQTDLLDQRDVLSSASQQVQKLFQRTWAAEQGTIWQQGTQLAIGAVLSNVGVPQGSKFVAAWDAIQVPPAFLSVVRRVVEEFSKAILEMTKDLMEKAMQTAVGVGVDLVGAIPVVGWVVEAAFEVGLSIWELANLIKKQREAEREAKKKYVQRQLFSPGVDKALADVNVLQRMQASKDWTSIFSPLCLQVSGPDLGASEIEQDMGLRIGCFEIGQSRVGFVPGTTQLHRELQALDLRGGGWKIEDTGAFFPSARSLSLSSWAIVTGVGPSMYTVDAEGTGWEGYLADAVPRMMSSVKDDRLRSSLKKYYRRIFGNDYNPEEGEATYERSVPVQALKTLRKRQSYFLRTLQVAYVSDEFGAMADVGLSDDQRKYRRLLLDHPAVCRVDVNNIPDREYRAAVVDAQARAGCEQVAAAPETDDAHETPQLAHIGEPAPRFPQRPGGGAGVGGGAALAGAAGLAALLLR